MFTNLMIVSKVLKKWRTSDSKWTRLLETNLNVPTTNNNQSDCNKIEFDIVKKCLNNHQATLNMIQDLHETCIKTKIMSLKFISRVYEKIGTNDEERSLVNRANETIDELMKKI